MTDAMTALKIPRSWIRPDGSLRFVVTAGSNSVTLMVRAEGADPGGR